MGNLRKKLAAFTELPESSFGGCQFVEIESNTSVKIDGCMEILSYDENEASFLTKEAVITVSGQKLEIRSYGNSTVRITGEIGALYLGKVQK